jgi:hypothetical protein
MASANTVAAHEQARRGACVGRDNNVRARGRIHRWRISTSAGTCVQIAGTYGIGMNTADSRAF